MANGAQYACNFVDASGTGFPGTLTLTFLDGTAAKHGSLHKALAPHVAKAGATTDSMPYPTDAFPITVALDIEGLGIDGATLGGIFLVSPLGPPIVAMAVTQDAPLLSTQFGLITSDGSEIGGWLSATPGNGPWSFLGTPIG